MPSSLSKFASRATLMHAACALCFVAVGSLTPAAAQIVPLVSPQYGAPPEPSALTVHFLAVTRPTVAFLERSSALAVTQAAGRRLRAFAHREEQDQAASEDALAGALAPVFVSNDPLDVAAAGAATIDDGAATILSGLPRVLRTPGARAIAVDRAIATEGQADLARLATLTGSDFDAYYRETQIAGLRRLVAAYRDYVQNGDDDRLRAISVHTLPRVVARLAALIRS